MKNKGNGAGIKYKIEKALKTHLVDSTALMVPTTPIFAAFETFVAGMSIENSVNARLLAYGLTYAGMGRVFTKGLDISRRLFKIKPETKEKIKQFHDAAYTVAYNFAITPAFYYAAGVRDIKQIAIGTGIAMGLGTVLGGPMGYFVDGYRDLTGIKDSERIPKSISHQPSKFKMGLAAVILATSLGVTAGVYELKNSIPNIVNPHSYNLEKTVGASK